jgi:hypothetical protein
MTCGDGGGCTSGKLYVGVFNERRDATTDDDLVSINQRLNHEK